VWQTAITEYLCHVFTNLQFKLRHDGGFATQDAAKNAGRADAKKIKYEPIMAIYGFLS
jgi:hypothetical protein